MGDFSLIVPKVKDNKSALLKLKSEIIKRFHFIKRNSDFFVSKKELYPNLFIYEIRLPYENEKVSKKIKKINAFIENFKNENSEVNCIIPHAYNEFGLIGCMPMDFSKGMVFKVLLINILNDIFTVRGIALSDLNISIVHGSSIEELYSFIQLLSPYIKLLTVITDNKKLILDGTESIFEETGLSVAITDEYKNVLEKADVIINFKDLRGIEQTKKIFSNSLIINFGLIDNVNSFINCDVINGVNVFPPSKILTKIDINTLNFYDINELVGILLIQRTNNENKPGLIFNDYKLIEEIASTFKKDGYRISNFIGRRGIIETNGFNGSKYLRIG